MKASSTSRFVHFPEQPVVWQEISIITAALRNDCQDKQTQFLRGLFETLPGRVQCEMLLKATEQCFNTLEKAEMLLLLLRRFPESVVQHGVSLGETLLEAENIEDQETPVNCFRKLFVCDVLPLVIHNPDMRLPASLLHKYLHKAAEFYIAYVTKAPSAESQHQGLSLPFLFPPPDKDQTRTFVDILHRMKELCRYISNFDNEAHLKYKNQVVYSTMLVFFKNAFQYVSMIQAPLFQGPSTPIQSTWILLEDLSNVYSDVDVDRNKHIHKKRKLADGREKTMAAAPSPAAASLSPAAAASLSPAAAAASLSPAAAAALSPAAAAAPSPAAAVALGSPAVGSRPLQEPLKGLALPAAALSQAAI
ncbi:UNVERIFIED_CONTAM: hypothetical protein FKN15_064717 [Acipenser sinensis]